MNSKNINFNVVIGFDFGMKYIGVAVGQKISKTASPVKSLNAINGTPDWDNIASLINEWKPDALVVGLPLNMDGTTQFITDAAQNFASLLEKNYKLPVYTVDERLSTWEAKTRLKLHKKKFTRQELIKINNLSAVILTEQWLND